MFIREVGKDEVTATASLVPSSGRWTCLVGYDNKQKLTSRTLYTYRILFHKFAFATFSHDLTLVACDQENNLG